MSVYKKLQEARILLQNTKLNKSGVNKFAGYQYFELGDFLPQIQNICQKVGLCGVVSFNAQDAYLTLHDTDGEGFVTFTSPMSSAALKGCHDVQNLGAVQTYLRRYLWTNAFEIVEHDALDSSQPVIDVEELEEMILLSKDMDELKKNFAHAYNVAKKDKDALVKINKAKEDRKAQLA